MIKDVVRFYPPDVWGVLCLDVWHNDGADDRFYLGVVDHLKEYNIGAIVNCTSDVKIDYNDISIYNTLKKYAWSHTDHNNELAHNQILLELVKASGTKKISGILNKELFNQHAFFLNSRDAFNYHVQNFYSNVTNWIIVSTTWNHGMHKGPLGVDQQLKLPLHNFNMFPQWSVQTDSNIVLTTEQIEEDAYVWASIDNKGYRLVTQVGGKWQK